MRLLLRIFVAFCVGTVLAQAIILGLAAARGNLSRDTTLKAIALLNGIDISGDRLQKMLDDAEQRPNPTYEDVEEERARQNKNIDMRERSIAIAKQQVEEMLAELREEVAAYDRRKDEFYSFLEAAEQNLLDESLKEVQRTLESLNPEQAKDQLKKFLEADEMDDVVAIVKGMPLDKRKKILGEFVGAEETDQLNEILTRLRQGEPKASLIQKARSQAAPD
jgi:vacuolar-type H+-ATPase subunit I/STV1